MISSRARYAIRILVELARRYGGAPVAARSIAERQEIPPGSLDLVLAALLARRLIRAPDGAVGGYVLARPPRDVSLGELVREMDGPITLTSSVEPFGCECGCTDPANCRLRDAFEEARDALAGVLDSTTLHDITYNRRRCERADVGAPIAAAGEGSE